MRLIAAAFLITVLCAASAQEAEAPADRPAVPFQRLATGQAARCMSANGCVAMDVEAFRQILRAAIQRGAQACGHST